MKGPTVQDNLLAIIMRFRTHNYVLTADIEKMYRQVRIQDQHTKFQKILWREHTNHPVQTYSLQTVTYGTTSAPFLAIRCLKQLAHEYLSDCPVLAGIIEKDFYVDDLLTGAHTILQAKQLRNDLITLLREGGFELRKWRSNKNTEIIDDQTTIDDSYHIPSDKLENTKTLGLMWNSTQDIFTFCINFKHNISKHTKRTVLSSIAQIFDPLGTLGPVITVAKSIMQKLWKLQIN